MLCHFTWRKLQEHTLDSARFGADIFEGLPVVFAHLEVVADAHADPDAEPVADKDVEEDIVPPALVEVGQEVAEENLREFPHDGDAPANAVVPDDQGLHAPAPVVAKCEPVQTVVEFLSADVPAVDSVLLLTVDGVVLHPRVQPDDDGPGRVVVLVEEELDEEEVEDGDAEDAPPDSGVRPDEGSVGQRQHGDDHEEDEDPDQSGEDVAVPGESVVPGEGSVGQPEDTDHHQADGLGLVEILCKKERVQDLFRNQFLKQQREQ